MPLLRLAEHAVFDDTDGAGVILDTNNGVYLSLNATATLMLQTALRVDTVDTAIGLLRERINASDTTLKAGIDALTIQLDGHALLTPRRSEGSR
jgi:thiamine biosynthesis lipoprotein ApbE